MVLGTVGQAHDPATPESAVRVHETGRGDAGPPDEARARDRAETRARDRSVIAGGLRWSTIGYPLNVGLLFLSQVLAANLLDPSDFGTYSLAISIVTLGALIAQLGIPQSLLRRASAALIGGREAEARHEILSALLIAVVAATVAGLLVGSPIGTEFFSEVFPKTAAASIATLIGIRLALRVLENLVPENFRSFRDYKRATIFDTILTNFLLAGAFTALLLGAIDVDLDQVMLLTVAVSAIALVPPLNAIASKLRHTHAAGFDLRNPVEPALWAATMGRALIAQLDLLVVGALGTSRDVALYAAPFRLALLVGLPLIAVNQVVTPLIAGWYAQRQIARLERTLQGTAALATIVALVIGLGYLVAGEWILRALFGPTYGEAWPVLMILVVGQVLQTWTGSCGFAMMMTGHHRVYAVVLGVSSVVTFGLDVVLFEAMGVEGVALATAIMLVGQNVVNMLLLRRLAGLRTVADLRLVGEEIRTLRDARRRAPR
jgi:O-antigen/teichoic acid export membrane protein